MKKKILGFSLCLFVHVVCAGSLYEQTGAAQKYMRGDVSGALAEYNQLIMQDPHNPVLNFNMGVVLYTVGQFEQAEQYFKRAVQGSVVVMQWLSLANLGNVYAHQKQYDDAIESLEKALTYDLKKEDKERLEYNLEVIKQLKRQEEEKSPQQDQQESSDDQKDQKDEKQCDDCKNKQNGNSDSDDTDSEKSSDDQKSDGHNDDDEQKSSDENKSQDTQSEKEQKSSEESAQQRDEKSGKDEKKQDQKSAQQKQQEAKAVEDKKALEDMKSDQEQKMSDQAQQAQSQDFAQDNQKLQNALQEELEKSSSDDERLSVQEAALMDAYDQREELIGKQVIAKRMAAQQQSGGVRHGKNW